MTPVVPREDGHRWYKHDKILENTTTRHKVIHNFYKPSENTIVLQSEFKYTMTYIIYKYFVVLVPSAPAFAWDYRCRFDRAVG